MLYRILHVLLLVKKLDKINTIQDNQKYLNRPAANCHMHCSERNLAERAPATVLLCRLHQAGWVGEIGTAAVGVDDVRAGLDEELEALGLVWKR